MKYVNMLSFTALSALLMLTFFSISPVAYAANTKCTFTKDLELGTTSEEVRCLQKYLNANGFQIAASGIGSPGKETNVFRDLTKKALAKWQAANKISPANGFFGAVSRKKYNELVGTASPTSGTGSSGASSSTLPDLSSPEISAILQQIGVTSTPKPSPSPVASLNTSSETTMRQLMVDALKAIKNAETKVREAGRDGTDITVAKKEIENARTDLFDAMKSYFGGDFAKSKTSANHAIGNAEDAIKDAGGKTSEVQADDLLATVGDAVDNAWKTMRIAKADKKEVTQAQSILQNAEDLFKKAEKDFEDDNYDTSIKNAKDAQSMVDDALDAIGSSAQKNTKTLIANVKKIITSLQKDIDNGLDRGDDVSDAQALLKQANKKMADAQTKYDSEDYDEAATSARQARDLARTARDDM